MIITLCLFLSCIPTQLAEWDYDVVPESGHWYVMPKRKAASSERLRDRVDELKASGPIAYCSNVAEYWDDGAWARSMGVARAVLPRLPTEPMPYETPDTLPRDGIHLPAWSTMTPREQLWYVDLFDAGWTAGAKFIAEHPAQLIDNPHDFSGVIPYRLRMQMKQERFEKCLEAWPPIET